MQIKSNYFAHMAHENTLNALSRHLDDDKNSCFSVILFWKIFFCITESVMSDTFNRITGVVVSVTPHHGATAQKGIRF